MPFKFITVTQYLKNNTTHRFQACVHKRSNMYMYVAQLAGTCSRFWSVVFVLMFPYLLEIQRYCIWQLPDTRVLWACITRGATYVFIVTPTHYLGCDTSYTNVVVTSLLFQMGQAINQLSGWRMQSESEKENNRSCRYCLIVYLVQTIPDWLHWFQ